MKCIGGEIMVSSFERALELKKRGYIVTPDPTSSDVQAAHAAGAIKEFERHSRLGFVTKEAFLEEVERLRKLGFRRITLKTGAYSAVELAMALRYGSEAKIDLITMDGAPGGTGMSPWSMMNEWGIPTFYLQSLAYEFAEKLTKKGMRVPDDVTLLLCDDNWGNIRKLPPRNEKERTGGYGIYYHFDYVGGPRNYKWLNTTQISRVWEQMHLAYQYGADRIWIVNVGDIKPMEFPIEFFLDYARDPMAWNAEDPDEYTLLWCKQYFKEEFAPEMAEILSKYTKYNSRRKPELLSPETYSLIHYQEAETVVKEYNMLALEAEQIYLNMPEEYKDAFYQLVLYPVKACANLNELYYTVGLNRMYASQGRAITNELADKARKLFDKDAELSHYYNKVMADGKWNHMMDQTHISYTYWQQPPKDTMPDVSEIKIPDVAEM